jgi:esterase/lipase
MEKTDLIKLEEAYSKTKSVKNPVNEAMEIGGVSLGDPFLYEVIPTWTGALISSLVVLFGVTYSEKIKSVVNSFVEKYAESKLKNDPEISSMMKSYTETDNADKKREIFLNINDRLSNTFFSIFKLSPTQKSNVWNKMKEKL